MENNKLKKILSITLLVMVLLLVLQGIWFYSSSKQPKAPAFKATTISGTIASFGSRDEFTIEKEGKVVFQAKATDLPQLQYRISQSRRMSVGTWYDLKLGDRVELTYTYDSSGNVLKSRVLYMYH